MGRRKSQPLLLLVSLLQISILSLTSAEPSTDEFHSVLRAHGLPIGLVPKNITSFTHDESTGKFEVYFARSCSAKFENEVRYDFNMTGILTYGQIGDLEGMSAQELFLWFPVKGIRVDVPTSGLIYFDVGGVVSKQFSLALFETPPDCVELGEGVEEVVNVDGLKRPAEEPDLQYGRSASS